jgi:hypothetical protein
MNRWIDSGPMKVMETSAMKKYQRGRKGIVMLVLTLSHLELLRELSAIQLRTKSIALKSFLLVTTRRQISTIDYLGQKHNREALWQSWN